jgi:hypothetical protein
VARFDGTTGKVVQNSGVTIDDSNNVGGLANLNFSGTGNRITGDFSNATHANRVMFQSSTTNGFTLVGALPNGTSTNSGFQAYATSSGLENASIGQLAAFSTEVAVSSVINGTGTYLPMTFYTGGSERVRVDTSGNVGIGTSSLSSKLTVVTGGSFIASFFSNDASSSGIGRIDVSNNASVGITLGVYGSNYSGGSVFSVGANGTAIWSGGAAPFAIGTFGVSQPLIFGTNSNECMRIDSSGNLLVGGTTAPTSSDNRLAVIGTRGIDCKNTGGATAPNITSWNNATTGDNVFVSFRTETADTPARSRAGASTRRTCPAARSAAVS